MKDFLKTLEGLKGMFDDENEKPQMETINKIYSDNGLSLIKTCYACPEQYDVFKDEKQVAYYRLRHGYFRVDYPDCGGECIYEAEPNGDGIFENDERISFMSIAMEKLLEKLKETE